MGNREDLVVAAKRCLVERGWARTTVRDIAATAGVSHAAIGYHFGSRENLLVHALLEAVEDLGRQIERDQQAGGPGSWEALIESFSTHRTLWVAQLEAIAQAEHVPAVRQLLAEGQKRSRAALGSVRLALLLGLMVESLIDPETAPSLDQVKRELAAMAADPSAAVT